MKRGDPKVYQVLEELNIPYEYYEHPEIPTIEAAIEYWKDLVSSHCKNLFFRNHKGKKHYLVILEYHRRLAIRDLELLLKQGKLTLASDKRLDKYLGLKAGSVSPFGLINDTENHVHVFFDENLHKAEKISFHPNINTATLVISFKDFMRYMEWTGNSYEFIKLHD